MIQFNLLPDVKLEYIRARYRKRLIMAVSIAASGVFLVIFILLFLFVRVNQVKYMKDLDKDVKTLVEEIRKTPDLDKMLTVQNQLNSLPGLHDQKVVGSRLLDYLGQITPVQVTISDVSVDFETNTMSIKGNADALSTVNKFADTLKLTSYVVNKKDENAAKQEGKAFKDVVLKSFNVEKNNTSNPDKPIVYELGFAFDPIIFSIIKEEPPEGAPSVELSVPNIISTQSGESQFKLFAPQPEVNQPTNTRQGR